LRGLAVCGRCGSPILTRSATIQRRGRISPAAYVCRARKLSSHNIEVRCDAPIVPVAEIDDRVWRAIAAEVTTPQLAERLAERERAAHADADATHLRLRIVA